MNVQWTRHALERAVERSGLSKRVIEQWVWDAWTTKGPGYFPGVEPGTVWVKIDGPVGKATAVCSVSEDGEGVVIITVRESETVGQGERANEKLTHRPFANLLKGMK